MVSSKDFSRPLAPEAKAASEVPRVFITLRLGDETFAIDVSRVREVLELTEITRVPSAPSYLRGVVNVRGSAIPVVDLRLRFGLPPGKDSVDTRIVVLDLEVDGERMVVGGLADSVRDVIELTSADLRAPPRLAVRWSPDMVAGLATRNDQFIIVLDVVRVFQSDAPLLAADVETPAPMPAAVYA
jgi:purine-binding chemotaxis protein CheW